MNEMGGACSRYWGRGEVYTDFLWVDLRERCRLKDQGVDGKVTLKLIFRKWDGGMDCIGSLLRHVAGSCE